MNVILGHLEASGGHFGVDFGFIWGSVLGSRARAVNFAKIARRFDGSTIFEVPGGPKRGQKRNRKQLAAPTVLEECLGSNLGNLWGSIWGPFWVDFGSQNEPGNR